MAVRYEPLEDLREILGHLFKGELQRFIFTVLERAHQLLDLVIASVQLLLPLKKFRFLFGERDELIKRFLVNVAIREKEEQVLR